MSNSTQPLTPPQPAGSLPRHTKTAFIVAGVILALLGVQYVVRHANDHLAAKKKDSTQLHKVTTTQLPADEIASFGQQIDAQAKADDAAAAKSEHGSTALQETDAATSAQRPMTAQGGLPAALSRPATPAPAMPSTAGAVFIPTAAPVPARPTPYQPSYQSPSPVSSEAAQLQQDWQKRQYLARFASNIAYSDRARSTSHTPTPAQPARPPILTSGMPYPYRPGVLHPPVPTPYQYGIPQRQATQPNAGSRSLPQQPPHRLPGTYLIQEGTVLDTVLMTRLNGDFAGPVKVMVSEPLYDRAHERVLVPAGSVLLGNTRAVASIGQSRLAVVFHRVIRPDGYSVNLDQFTGLDQIGETALSDKVNHHYLQIFGVSVALGAVAGLSELSVNQSSTYPSGSSMYRQGFGQSLSQSATRVLDRFLNIFPTITIREGTRVKVYISQDIYVPANNPNPVLD